MTDQIVAANSVQILNLCGVSCCVEHREFVQRAVKRPVAGPRGLVPKPTATAAFVDTAPLQEPLPTSTPFKYTRIVVPLKVTAAKYQTPADMVLTVAFTCRVVPPIFTRARIRLLPLMPSDQ